MQQAVRMVLEPIYEAMFLGFSYGFRPRRSAHDALDALAYVIGKKRTDWVLDADIRNFFDSIDHGRMQKFIEHRISDRRLVRLLMKWLKAGVMEEGRVHETQEGTPQGGIISPLLGNMPAVYAKLRSSSLVDLASALLALARLAFVVARQRRPTAWRSSDP